jgi:hypothetical protein
LWICLALATGLMLGGPFLENLRPRPDAPSDFFQEWASARNVCNGLPVYTAQHVTRARYLGDFPRSDQAIWVEYNAHPPTSVLLGLPFAGLDYPHAVLAWNLVSLAALAASVWLVLRALQVPVSIWTLLPLAVLLLMCVPLWVHLAFGQLGLVLLLLTTAAWIAERTGRPAWAGALLAIATAIKIFPGFLFLYFAIRRQWRALAAGALVLLGLTVMTAAVLGVEAYRSYAQDVLPRVSWFRAGWNNASLPGFWSKLFDPAPDEPRSVWRTEALWQSVWLARIATLVSCTVVTAIVLQAAHRARSRGDCDRAFGIALIGTLLVWPVVWEHYFVLLLVPMALAWWTAFPTRPAARFGFLAAQAALFFIPPADVQGLVIPGGYPRGLATPVHALTVLSFQLYALLALFALAVRTARPAETERLA